MSSIIRRKFQQTTQPQIPVGVNRSNPFVSRGILFAFNGATKTDAVSVQVGAPVGVVTTVLHSGGLSDSYSTDSTYRSFARPDTGWLGPLTVIVKFSQGASDARLFSKGAGTDDVDNPLRISINASLNGFYVVRSGAAGSYGAYQPSSAITTANSYKTVGIVFPGSTSWTAPTFYDGKTAVGSTKLFAGSDAAITGSSAPILTGNWNTGGQIDIEFLYVFPYAMTAAEVGAIVDAPLQVFAPLQRNIYDSTGGGSPSGAGSASFTFTGSGVGKSLSASAASASFSFTSSGVGVTAAVGAGASSFIFNASAVGSALGIGVGSSSFTFTCTGVGASSGIANGVGSASFSFSASGTSSVISNSVGSGNIVFNGSGVSSAIKAGVGSATFSFAAAGVGSSTTGSTTLSPGVGGGTITFTAKGYGNALQSYTWNDVTYDSSTWTDIDKPTNIWTDIITP